MTPLALSFSSFFFFNDTATTEIYTLSLHDALPIFAGARSRARRRHDRADAGCEAAARGAHRRQAAAARVRQPGAGGRVGGRAGRAAAGLPEPALARHQPGGVAGRR